MKNHIFDAIIPIPFSTVKSDGSLPLQALKSFSVAAEFAPALPMVQKLFDTFALPVAAVAGAGDFAVKKWDGENDNEAFRITVSDGGITVEAVELPGLRYALGVCTQLFAAALIAGPGNAVFDCGTVIDRPRFKFRSFMLDSARHFQSVDVIKKVLKMMSVFRLNTFHWHLVDGQGWRVVTKTTAGLENRYTLAPGFYTAKDIREVVEYAKSLDIAVIPEIDMPGHSSGTLKEFPQYACVGAEKPGEFCLGNPEGMEFLKNILREVIALFPESNHIHIGGDEANVANWEKCPRCRKAMEDAGLNNMRELENKFMVEMSRFVIGEGRTPILWGTCSGQKYPADTVMQAWLDIREPIRMAQDGNKIIYSVHTSLYFDYPANLSEPWESWMFQLTEQGVYMADPYVIWPNKVREATLGTEACLWTEMVPQWRVVNKILPRLAAYSECAWSMPERKNWSDFQRRKELLNAAGFMEMIWC